MSRGKIGFEQYYNFNFINVVRCQNTVIIVTIRVILSSIFAGPLSYLLFSIGGAYLSLLFMYLASKIKDLSLIGISIIGAIGHNIGQLIVASLIIENILAIGYLPFMLMASLVTGMFVGLVSRYTIPKLKHFYSKFY
nr:Gx transporter family protein [Clostridioides difficile]